MLLKVENAKKAKRALSLAQHIVRDIEAGAHAPGDRLPREEEMLARYDVARATLREALRFLELQGVIHLQLGRSGGPVVARPQTGDLRIPDAGQFKLIKVGDQIQATYVEAVAVALEPAKK